MPLITKFSNDELIAAFKEMTLIGLSDFVKLFEGTFDAETATPVAITVAVPAVDALAAKEKDEFEVILKSTSDKKIAVVKVVKNLTDLGLKEVKDLVDSAFSTILPVAKKEDAEKIKVEVEGADGKVVLK